MPFHFYVELLVGFLPSGKFNWAARKFDIWKLDCPAAKRPTKINFTDLFNACFLVFILTFLESSFPLQKLNWGHCFYRGCWQKMVRNSSVSLRFFPPCRGWAADQAILGFASCWSYQNFQFHWKIEISLNLESILLVNWPQYLVSSYNRVCF